MIVELVWLSRLPAGSSARMIAGLLASARAIATRLLLAAAEPARLTALLGAGQLDLLQQLSRPFLRSVLPTPMNSIGNMTFSVEVRFGTRL